MKVNEGSIRRFKNDNCPTEVPDSLLDRNWLDVVYGQTLERLNERGGLGIGGDYR